MPSFGHRLKDGASGVNTRKWEVITAPIDLDTLFLQGEEGDQGGNSDTARESSGGDAERQLISMEFATRNSRGHSLVVLGPPGQIIPLDVVVKKDGDWDGRPNVAHVVRSPDKSTDQENWNVEVGENPEFFAKEVEGYGQRSTDRETPQKAVVDGTGTEHPLGTESAPKNGSGEESVVSGASEMILLLG